MQITKSNHDYGTRIVIEPRREPTRLYTLVYETETGVAECTCKAMSLAAAICNFRATVPAADHGTDAYITNQYGDEFPMEW